MPSRCVRRREPARSPARARPCVKGRPRRRGGVVDIGRPAAAAAVPARAVRFVAKHAVALDPRRLAVWATSGPRLCTVRYATTRPSFCYSVPTSIDRSNLQGEVEYLAHAPHQPTALCSRFPVRTRARLPTRTAKRPFGCFFALPRHQGTFFRVWRSRKHQATHPGLL